MPARANASQTVCRVKHARLAEPHIAPFVALADEIAHSQGLASGEVPYPDPGFAGTNARALVLLESPGPKTDVRHGSGLLSVENDDPTAERAYIEYARSGLDWRELLHWNVVPWPLEAGKKPRAVDHMDATPWLARLVELMPKLEAVMLLGRVAERGWRRAQDLLPERVRALPVVTGPHPSRLGLIQPGATERFAAAVAQLAEHRR